MENFREHERDCKTKGYRMKSLLPEGYFTDENHYDEERYQEV